MKPFIYLASPYTKGDPCINTNFQMRMFKRFVADGVVDAYIPLWSHFQHSAFPEPYTTWINYDLAIIPRLDGVIRLNASIPELGYFEDKSSGADGEAAFAVEKGLPVWYSVVDLYSWANARAIKHLEALRNSLAANPFETDDWRTERRREIDKWIAYIDVVGAARNRAIAEADVFGKPMTV